MAIKTEGCPASDAFEVTPDDDSTLPQIPHYLYIGVAGDLSVKFGVNGPAIIFRNLSVGYHPLRPTVISSSNTTADEIIGLVVSE